MYTYLQILYIMYPETDWQTLNVPTTAFVRTSLNWAFAVSKSKSDSNCKVVAFEFFTRSRPLLLFLDLRLPVCEYQQKFRQIKQTQLEKLFSNHLEQVHPLWYLHLIIHFLDRWAIFALTTPAALPSSDVWQQKRVKTRQNIAMLSVRCKCAFFIQIPCFCLCFWFSVLWPWILAAFSWDGARPKHK